MVTTTSLKVGESLTIGLYFNDNYQLPTTCNLITYIGGVCVGNLFTQEPPIDEVGIYYTIRLSSQDTSKMRGYRDLIVVLDDPLGFGNKKTIVGGILFDRLADEFISTSENHGYNMLIGMTIDESVVTGNIELLNAIKGDDGADGNDGVGIIPGGLTSQVLSKKSDSDFDTEWVDNNSIVPIETISKNGTPLPITAKNVDITVPTKTSELEKDDVYTKTEINNKLSAVYKYKGSVLTYDLLPTDAENADVWNVTNGTTPELNGMNYAWNSTLSEWDELGGIIGLATLTENGLLSKEDFALLAGKFAGTYLNPDYVLLNKQYTDAEMAALPIGSFFYSADQLCWLLKTSANTYLNIGEETTYLCKNGDAVTHLEGQVVKVSSGAGNLDVMQLASSADGKINALATQDVLTSGSGRGMYCFGGKVRMFPISNVKKSTDDDATWIEGAELYLCSEAGRYSTVKEVAPAKCSIVGTISGRNGANISVSFRPQKAIGFSELSDVDGTTNSFLDAETIYIKKADGTLKSISKTDLYAVLDDYFAKLSGGNVFSGDQRINAKLGIGVAPSFQLDVNGIIQAYNQIRTGEFFTVINKGVFRGVGASAIDIASNDYISFTCKYSSTPITPFTILVEGSTNFMLSKYQFNAASPTADTINDRKTSNNAGVKIEERCTVANVIKGNGTWVVDSKILADGSKQFGNDTNNVTIDPNGTIKLNGTATVFDDLKASALLLKQTGAGISSNIPEACVEYLDSADLSDYMVQSLQMPHTWKIGSVIHPHIHLVQNSAAIPNMLIQYRWQQNGGAIVTAWTNYKSNVPVFAYTSGSINQILHDGGITPPVGASLSDIIEFRIIRDNANTSGLFAGVDTVAGVVRVKSFDIHFESDQLGGSNMEYTK